MSDDFKPFVIQRRVFGSGNSFLPVHTTETKDVRMWDDTATPDPAGFEYRLIEQTVNGVDVPYNDVHLSQASGTALWAINVAPTEFQSLAYSLAADSGGNIVVVGEIVPAQFDSDIFISKYSPAIPTLLWSKRINSSEGQKGQKAYGVAIDGNDNIIVTGSYTGTVDFGGQGRPQDTLTTTATQDIFLVKYNSSGAIQWVYSFGAFGNNYGLDVAVNASNEIFILVSFNTPIDFGNSTGVLTPDPGTAPMAVAKLSSAGIAQWSAKYLPTPGSSYNAFYPASICLDAANNIYIAFTSSLNTPTRGVLAKLSGTNGALMWDKVFTGSTGQNFGLGVAVDPVTQNVLFAGKMTSTNFGGGTYSGQHPSFQSACIASYKSDGTFLWVRSFGGKATYEVTVTNAGIVLFGGDAGISSLLVWNDSLNQSDQFSGPFVASMTLDRSLSSGSGPQGSATDPFTFRWSNGTLNNNNTQGHTSRIITDRFGNAYYCGYYQGTAQFGGKTITSYGGSSPSAFMVRVIN
jgi:hypothetical protein